MEFASSFWVSASETNWPAVAAAADAVFCPIVDDVAHYMWNTSLEQRATLIFQTWDVNSIVFLREVFEVERF